MKKVVVAGSLNMDLVVETSRRPKPGETISGKGVKVIPGGKGANQAYAIGKLGGDVGMIGAVGDDEFGRALKKNLESAGVNTSGLQVMENETTGQAFITVDDQGENAIILISGANGKLSKELVQENLECIENCDILIMQLEIPVETVAYLKDVAMRLGKTVILDPAPAQPNLPESLWQGVDYIKPNESELEILVGRKMESLEELKSGAREMIQKGVKGVIVSLGGEGCLFVTDKEEKYFPANKVKAVDTTAAGDSFTAAFALALSQGKGCDEAIVFGQKVSSIVVTRKGAQTSIPTIDELER